MNLECEAEQPNVTIETIIGLLELYRVVISYALKEAVEYYEAIQSNKYLVFKNKMHTLLTKKSVMQLMNT
jgi:hypothetical protein